MTFASPVLLWSLLALVPLVAVYFLKIRPRRRPTTAYFLWEKVLTDRKPSRLWERLRNLVSLLIMAAAFIAIALGMSRPRVGEANDEDLLILIDNSLSMSARSAGGTRLDEAKEAARELARGMNGVQRAAVATLGARLRYVSHLSDNPRELLAAIDGIEPTHETLSIEALSEVTPPDEPKDYESTEAVSTSTAETEEPKRRLIFVTDGSHEAIPKGIEPLVVGDERPNVGLVGADLRFDPNDPQQLLFYSQIASTHEVACDIDLLLYHETEEGSRTLAKVVPLAVAPGLNPSMTLAVDDAPAGRWIAELDTETIPDGDALAADDTVYLVAYKEPPIRIHVVADEGYFFDRAVEAFADFSGGLSLVAAETEADVTLSQGAPPDDTRRSIVFLPRGESPWWGTVGEPIEVAAPRIVAENHPILRNIDALSIRFNGSRSLTPPPGSEVLLESETGDPLLYLAKSPSGSAVIVNLDPVDAEFYYSAWFPVIVRAAAEHLVGRSIPLASTRPPSARVELPIDASDLPAELVGPSGVRRPMNSAELNGLAVPGFYQVTAGETAHALACSVLSADETLLRARVDSSTPLNTTAGTRLDHWLVVMALVGVTAESWLYHRRKVG